MRRRSGAHAIPSASRRSSACSYRPSSSRAWRSERPSRQRSLWACSALMRTAEEVPHRVPGEDAEEKAQRPQGPRAEHQQLVEADGQQAVGRDRARPGVHAPDPLLPPLQALAPGARGDHAARLGHARGGGVAPVANHVDELGALEQPHERRRLGDRVGALLDQAPGVAPVDPEPEQIAKEPAASALGVAVEGRLESGDRLLEALLGDEPEHPPHAPGLKALPPEAPQAAHEVVPRDACRRAAPESRAPRRGTGPPPGPARIAGGGSAAGRGRACRFAPCRRRTRTAPDGPAAARRRPPPRPPARLPRCRSSSERYESRLRRPLVAPARLPAPNRVVVHVLPAGVLQGDSLAAGPAGGQPPQPDPPLDAQVAL